ncbi:acyl-CoA N-acyltransferase [Sparassis latifolia]|uniref:Acyl-CoA N-acyltransferase n=1 Tax=Sparassis crispa TaxID=139825 RepID=A0A401GCP7_9APHY|nr:acyl-CoA N-acyltransferase [Sparassis crispa]GBE79911.1 acyl-CoA N-acyltransferase [Sparassis crispa]
MCSLSSTSSSAAPGHEIIIVPDVGEPGRQELRQQCYDVRIDVFHHEQKFPLDTEIDDLDETATHILLRLVPSLTPIGTIRCSRNDTQGYYKLSRLAVLQDYRQYRFGRKLVLALHDYVRQDLAQCGRASTTVKAHSQIPVKGFYAKFGYSPEGDEFDEDGAPHQLMVARVSLSD